MEKKKKRTDLTPYGLALVVLVLGWIAWYQGGNNLVLAGLTSGGRTLFQVIPLLVAAFVTAGLIQTLVSKELVTRWLGAGSGWRGLALACVGGALIPGGPYVYYPIAGALLNTGAGIGVLVAFIAAKNLWSVSRIPMELALLGPDLTLIRFGITFIIPPLLGFLAELFFGRTIEKIRAGVAQ
jgi:uncharacterized membrane protein YraQ (UPF0718 family)